MIERGLGDAGCPSDHRDPGHSEGAEHTDDEAQPHAVADQGCHAVGVALVSADVRHDAAQSAGDRGSGRAVDRDGHGERGERGRRVSAEQGCVHQGSGGRGDHGEVEGQCVCADADEGGLSPLGRGGFGRGTSCGLGPSGLRLLRMLRCGATRITTLVQAVLASVDGQLVPRPSVFS